MNRVSECMRIENINPISGSLDPPPRVNTAECGDECVSVLCTWLVSSSSLCCFDRLCKKALLRSVDLWIKGRVKSRAFLLRRRACFPSPSARVFARRRTFLSTNTSTSVLLSCVYLWVRNCENRGQRRDSRNSLPTLSSPNLGCSRKFFRIGSKKGECKWGSVLHHRFKLSR